MEMQIFQGPPRGSKSLNAPPITADEPSTLVLPELPSLLISSNGSVNSIKDETAGVEVDSKTTNGSSITLEVVSVALTVDFGAQLTSVVGLCKE